LSFAILYFNEQTVFSEHNRFNARLRPRVMKLVHNVRVRVHAGSRVLVDEVLTQAETMARRNPDETFQRRIQEDNDGTVFGELWLEHQQPVRQFVRTLKEKLGSETCALIAANPTRYLDVATHCFLHLERKAFLAGECALVPPANAVIVRLNIAAFPATKEQATQIVSELFQKTP
jgi:RNA binding exosome subunit